MRAWTHVLAVLSVVLLSPTPACQPPPASHASAEAPNPYRPEPYVKNHASGLGQARRPLPAEHRQFTQEGSFKAAEQQLPG